jgi:hypothetical protein
MAPRMAIEFDCDKRTLNMHETDHARGADAMEAVQVRVKWQKQKFDVSVRLHAPVEDFKSQVRLPSPTKKTQNRK